MAAKVSRRVFIGGLLATTAAPPVVKAAAAHNLTATEIIDEGGSPIGFIRTRLPPDRWRLLEGGKTIELGKYRGVYT